MNGTITTATRWLAPLALAAVLALPAASASAAILALGNNPLSGTTSALEPQLGGTVVVDEDANLSWAAGNGTFSATVQSRVVQADDGTYDFYWRIFDTAYTGTDGQTMINAFRLGNFGPTVGLNGNYRTDGIGNVGPDIALVFAVPEGATNFIFSNGLRAGNESYFMFLDTEATSYAKTAVFDLSTTGGISTIVATYAPGAAVPEPATWALLIGGFMGTGAMVRRRKAAAAAA